MKLAKFGAALALVTTAVAYSLSLGLVLIGQQSIRLGEFDAQVIKHLPLLTPKEQITVELELKEDLSTLPSLPTQLVVTLGDNKGHDVPYYPKVKGNGKITFSIPTSQLPEMLKSKEKLYLTLIVADSTRSANLIKLLAEINPTAEFQELSKYVPATDNNLKPEIIHQFRQEPSTVNPMVPIAFIGLATVLFLALLGAWAYFLNENLFANLTSISSQQQFHNIAFIFTLIGFEWIIFRYYLSDSIFNTIYRAFILVIPGVYFGSGVLRGAYGLRKINKA